MTRHGRRRPRPGPGEDLSRATFDAFGSVPGPPPSPDATPSPAPGGQAPAPEQVLEALRAVVDPELDISIVELGLVRGVEVEEDTRRVRIALTLTSPMCPLGPEIVAAAQREAMTVPGVAGAEVDLVWSPPWDPRVDPSEEARAEMGIWD